MSGEALFERHPCVMCGEPGVGLTAETAVCSMDHAHLAERVAWVELLAVAKPMTDRLLPPHAPGSG